MGRLSAYSAQLVGNDFAVMPTKTMAVATPYFKEDEVVDDSLLESIDIEGAAQTVKEPRRYYKAVVLFLLSIFTFSVLLAGWALVSPRFLHAPATLSQQPIKVAAAPVVSLATQMQTIENQKVSISVGSDTTTAAPTDIAKWLSTNPSAPAGKQISVNKDAISAYLGTIATQYTKQPLSQIVVTQPDGTTSTIATGSDGSKPNTDSALAQISNGLLPGQGMNINLPVVSMPFQILTTSNFDKLLEVNVTTKQMYAYENGTLVKTFLVTAGATATPTPIGQFKIWQKLAEQDMRGYNPNGTKYFQPNVKWVNYFDHSGDAIHGNYWRPADVFGAVNTSHGCVGITNTDAEWVYNWAPIGTTVITHA